MPDAPIPAPLPVPTSDVDRAITEARHATVCAEAATAADAAAAHHLFRDSWMRLDARTRLRHTGDLALFARYLGAVQALDPADVIGVGAHLPHQPDAWANVTWGLVTGFVAWMLQAGYAIGSVNVRLATVKRYAKLAMAAGAIPEDAYLHISALRGYGGKAATNVDASRTLCRLGAKKAAPTVITVAQVVQLKQQPETPLGRRDALLVCLLFDHGLRVGEVAALTVGALDLSAGTITFYREKVDLTQAHRLTADTLEAARRHLALDRVGVPSDAPLLLGSRKDGRLVGTFGARSMQDRLLQLGQRIGVDRLSPHDGRHFWATTAARAGTPITDLRDAGGWSSFEMPSRYIERTQLANEGVRLQKMQAGEERTG